MIKHSDNPRYSQDEAGQWWYQAFGQSKEGRPWPRLRGYVKTCSVCSVEFLWQARTQNFRSENKGYFCSVRCANKSPNKFQGAPRGSAHRTWRGGRRETAEGYVQVWSGEHPNRNKNNYVYEHRLVMEMELGRYLLRTEQVHHKNGIRNDNRPENLELWATSQPPGQRVTEQKHCPTCSCS